ncbi:MATE efflux family protein [Prunus dulcis]|uniref:MATE efflux family protein n=1 Tax=Prunus dulcis TaxID=3755 RepID=A0A5H2XYY4_PRUDU|nr:MATE efflux family protein [Prunus dulcis]
MTHPYEQQEMDFEEQTAGLESALIQVPQEQSLLSRKQVPVKDEIVEEVKKQLLLAGPLVASNFLLFGMQLISVMYVGHVGELALAGASMATSFASVTGLSLTEWVAPLDTFCGQSYGAKQYHMLGIHMQRAMLVLLLPFAYAILESHARFLQAQNNVVPLIVSTGVATLVHLLNCWVLVYKTSLGYRGAALATSVTYSINALLLALYVRVSPSCKLTWTGFSKEAFHGIPNFLKLSIPSAVMVSLEVWSFEMIVLLSGFLPNPKLETSALSISTRVSNQLGAGQPRMVCIAICVALSIVVTEGIVAAAVMILARNDWGYCYSSEKEVVKYVGEMLIFVALSHFFDGPQSVLSGVIRGSGQQKIGAYVNLGAYYLIGIPTAVLLAFVQHIGGKGLWIGIIMALFVQALSLAIIVICTDWEKEVKKASDSVFNRVTVAESSS